MRKKDIGKIDEMITQGLNTHTDMCHNHHNVDYLLKLNGHIDALADYLGVTIEYRPFTLREGYFEAVKKKAKS